ncbi:MAG TPA: hypothetical protein VFV32_00970 [Acidimicrobiales bacterium]|nr:hypothetical protein [Acidimicrobiales bacterium]
MSEELSAHPLRDRQRPNPRGALDRWLPAGVAVIGAVLLFAGYWGASDSTQPGEQLPHIASATIPGAVLVIAAAVLLLRQEMARARQESAAVSARFDALVDWLVTASPDAAPGSLSAEESNAGGHIVRSQ